MDLIYTIAVVLGLMAGALGSALIWRRRETHFHNRLAAERREWAESVSTG